MKIKELDLTKYNYKRICVATKHGNIFMPENTEESLLNLWGEEEIDETRTETSENGWLKLFPLSAKTK
jgi:hypothetical protein